MAASGYGTEATWESIFDVPAAKVDATRFGNMNAYIGTQFNFYITGDSGTDITDTKLTGMLAAATHFLIYELYIQTKASKFANPWEQMQVELGKIDFADRYENLIKKAIKITYGAMEITTSDLPLPNTRTYSR